MPRITVAGGVSDKRTPPAKTTLPSVDQMLRARKPAPVESTVIDDGEGEVSGDDGTEAVVPAPAEPSTADVRAWARENGHEVKDAGPIPKDAQAAYDAAHAG